MPGLPKNLATLIAYRVFELDEKFAGPIRQLKLTNREDSILYTDLETII